jgi:uncharacterized membrane protein YccC
MANWNYRVIRKNCQRTDTVTYQVHEVYYTEDGRIDCWTQQPVEPLGTSEAQLRNDVHAFLAAFRQPILEEKFVLGQLQLVEEKLERDGAGDLTRDYKNRANRASGYLFQMLGNHLLVKQNAELRAAYDKVDQALAQLWVALETPVAPKKIG